MIMDHYGDKWRQAYEEWQKQQMLNPPWLEPNIVPITPTSPILNPGPITPEEIKEFRRLLERAREYDKRTGQPDCELEEKKQTLKKLADLMGVKIDFL